MARLFDAASIETNDSATRWPIAIGNPILATRDVAPVWVMRFDAQPQCAIRLFNVCARASHIRSPLSYGLRRSRHKRQAPARQRVVDTLQSEASYFPFRHDCLTSPLKTRQYGVKSKNERLFRSGGINHTNAAIWRSGLIYCHLYGFGSCQAVTGRNRGTYAERQSGTKRERPICN